MTTNDEETTNNNTNNKMEKEEQEEVNIKARKEYTITKSRESWTDEEHGLFVGLLRCAFVFLFFCSLFSFFRARMMMTRLFFLLVIMALRRKRENNYC